MIKSLLQIIGLLYFSAWIFIIGLLITAHIRYYIRLNKRK